MRYAIPSILIFIFFAAGILYAQDYSEEEGRPVRLGTGLTQKQIGTFSVVTAEDADVTSDGKQVYKEDIYEYVGRKFKAVEARLKKIEEGQEDIKDRIKRLENSLSQMKKAPSSL
jgi:hypothetical protein